MYACWEWGCLRVLSAWGRLGHIRLPPYGSRRLHNRTSQRTHPLYCPLHSHLRDMMKKDWIQRLRPRNPMPETRVQIIGAHAAVPTSITAPGWQQPLVIAAPRNVAGSRPEMKERARRWQHP